MYSKVKFFLLFLLILRYPIDRDNQGFNKLDTYLTRDLEFCPKCFENQSEFCAQLRLDYEFNEDFINNVNILFGVRQNRVLSEIKNVSHRIFAKYLARDVDLNLISQSPRPSDEETIGMLSKGFFNESRLNGLQICPPDGVQRFVELFAKTESQLSIWMHMIVNIQPLLLPYLHSIGFPVPKTYANCGFTTFQSVDGVPLADLYRSDFPVKLKIAVQLLEGALKFSEGIEGFRIYITDLNMDNVVYSPEGERVSFVDLDTVLIVDGRKNPGSVHRHEYLECDNCFAFSPSDICACDRSDINLFAVCQLLREDLRKDRTKGFLYPVPEEYAALEEALNECVHCPETTCQSRFDVAVEMVETFKQIIKNNS